MEVVYMMNGEDGYFWLQQAVIPLAILIGTFKCGIC
jgi:hypothetical protein